MKRSFLRFSLLAASTAAVAALVACGGISDPTKRGSGERVATVSGALTGTNLPANTRVALVWKVGKTTNFAVGSDVAVLDGKFTMPLTTPPDAYFTTAEGDYDGLSSSSGGSGSLPPDPAPSPGTSTSGSPGSSGAGTSSGGSGASGSTSGGGAPFAFGSHLGPRDSVSGQINQPLNAAVAGFVVYVDTNNNGKLDIEGPYAASTDEVIGGNKELLLAYLRDGGALDYEKLRDRSGILPHAGYNLAWDEGRWLPLDVVELKIAANAKLPSAVCSGSDAPSVSGEEPSSSSSGSSGSSGTSPYSYPSSDDPRLRCSADGYSYTYDPSPSDCPTQPPLPVGLCADVLGYATLPCAQIAGQNIDPDQPVPVGWPCQIGDASTGGSSSGSSGTPIDAGPAPDAGF